MNIGCCKKGRFCKENYLSSAPAQLHCLTGILAEPKKALFLLYFVLYTIFSCLRHFSKEVGMAVFS